MSIRDFSPLLPVALILGSCSSSDKQNSPQPPVVSPGPSTPIGPPPAPTPLPGPDVLLFCDFEGDYGPFKEQSKVAPNGRRSSFTSQAASGEQAVKLTTLPGDNNVNGSGGWERNDLMLPVSPDYGNEGQEEWWAFSVLFPDDYVFPPGPGAGIIMDFHHTGSGGQANYEIQTIPGIGLRARGYGGNAKNEGKYDAVIADPYGVSKDVARNLWYHFVVHVSWSSHNGLMEGWLNGRRYQNYRGPTLYKGMSCYLKLANYHAPFGKPSSVVFDRVVRGTSPAAVSLVHLEP
jgi:hypothetical protein